MNLNKFKKFYNIKFLWEYAKAYFNLNYVCNINLLSDDKLIKLVTEKHKSIIRLGDGEIMLLNKEDVWFQKYNVQLKDLLLKLIQNYTNIDQYIVCVPQKYLTQTNFELKKISTKEYNAFRSWLPMKIWFNTNFPKETQYGDAHFFYKKDSFTKLYAYLKQKKIVIITNSYNYEKQRKYLKDNFEIVSYIQTEEKNAFDKYEKVILEIQRLFQFIEDEHEDRARYVFLCSCGPMAKALAFYIASKGYQAIDIGHGFEYLNENVLDGKLI